MPIAWPMKLLAMSAAGQYGPRNETPMKAIATQKQIQAIHRPGLTRFLADSAIPAAVQAAKSKPLSGDPRSTAQTTVSDAERKLDYVNLVNELQMLITIR